jgi:hypothetical protein
MKFQLYTIFLNLSSSKPLDQDPHRLKMLVRIRTETYADPSIHFDADPDQDPNPTPSFTIVEKLE